MTSVTPFISERVLRSNRRVARRIAALPFAQIARHFNDVRPFLDGTDLCSRGLKRRSFRGGAQR